MSLKIFNWIFLLPLWIKFRRLLTGVSCNKMVTLDKLRFFVPLKLFFIFQNHTISSTFSYLNILVHASALFAKTMACTDRMSHKPKLLLLSDNKLLWKERDACVTFRFFRIHKFWETSEGPPQYIFTGDKGFRQLSAMPLPCFVQQNFCSMAKKVEKFSKLQTKVSSECSCGHVKRNFDILARKYTHEAEIFFFSVQTCWRKKPLLFRKFFSNGSSRQVESSFLKPTETNWANGQTFLVQFPNFENN